MESNPSSFGRIRTVTTLVGLALCALFTSGCVTHKTLEMARGTSHLEWSQPPSLSATDIRDPESLSRLMLAPVNPLSDYLGQNIQPSTQEHLQAYLLGDESTNQACEVLAGILNHAIDGPLIFDSKRFARVRFRSQTTILLGERPDGEDLRRLNRLLLEDALPRELARLPDPRLVDDRRAGYYCLVPFALAADIALTPVEVVWAVVLFNNALSRIH